MRTDTPAHGPACAVVEVAAHWWRGQRPQALQGPPYANALLLNSGDASAVHTAAPATESVQWQGRAGGGGTGSGCQAGATPMLRRPHVAWDARRRALGVALRDLGVHMVLLGGCTALYLALSGKQGQQRTAPSSWRRA